MESGEFMSIQYSLAHLTAIGCTPPELTRIAARTGYDFVSLRIMMMKSSNELALDYSLAENPAMLRETRAALSETGLAVHDIELARIADEVDVKSYLPALEVGAELGVRNVISSIWTTDAARAQDQFNELCDMAQRLGQTINLEFVTWAAAGTLGAVAEVVRRSGHANAGILVDTLHFHRSRTSLDELRALPRNWFHFVHLCDAPDPIPTDREGLIFTGREERYYLGEGDIDIAAILSCMPPCVYSIELPSLQKVKEFGAEEHARRCLTRAQQYFAAHPVQHAADGAGPRG